MSQWVTNEVQEQIQESRMAKHSVMKSILREHIDDIDEKSLQELLMRIYTLFYDSSMVDSMFQVIQEREKQKEELQEMNLEDIASLAFGDNIEAEASRMSELNFLETDETAFESLLELSKQIAMEKVYSSMKEANIIVIADFFSAFHGTTSAIWETTSKLSEIERKNVLELFSLFVEKQIEKPEMNGDKEALMGQNLASSALSIDISDTPHSIFLYTPQKWLDKGQTQRLTIGLLIQDEWAKYISIMSVFIATKLNIITKIILGTTRDDLSNIAFRLVDLNLRNQLKVKIKDTADYIVRCSLAWEQIQSSQTF